jgi:hypothetical protein
MRSCVLAIVAALTIAGCGSAGADPADNSGHADYTEQQVKDAAKLRSSDGGITYRTPTGCTVAVVLDSPEEVELYRGGGDVVASNEAGTVGAKISDATPDCINELTAALAALK